MKFELDEHHRDIADDELIADLQRVAAGLNKATVTRSEQDERGRFNSCTYVRRFRGWFNAIEKAGLQKSRTPPYIPEEDLLKNLEEVWISLGRQPRLPDLTKPLSKYSGGTYEKRFRGWRNALEAFVASINKEETVLSAPLSEKQTELEGKQKGPRTINWRLRFIVMRRDNFKCRACGRSPATDPTITFDVDHIKAWSKGGPTILENLQTLCTRCNIGKSDLEFENAPANEEQNVEA